MALPSLGRPPVLLDIVEEHFDELDFLWEYREANVFTRDWTLVDLAEHDERAEAHLDGLRLAELHAVDLADERLTGEETFAALAAALVLHETGGEEARARIAEALRSAEAGAFHGIRIALRHLAPDGFVETLEDLLCGEDPVRGAGAWDVLAFHRRPVSGRVDRLLGAEDPGARALALGAAGRAGVLGADEVAAAMAGPDPSVRRAALQAAARVGMPNLLPYCRDAALREIDPDPEAVAFLGVLGDPADVGTLHKVLGRRELAAAAIGAFGAMGRVGAVPLLIELMADDELGATATEAYRRITAAPDIEAGKPFPPPEVAEGEDEDEALPPDPLKARADWETRGPQMSPEVRWQSGLPVPSGQLPPSFDMLTLESRRDVYLQLRALGGRSVPDLELEALARTQAVPR
jgi:uncharacterized protein (TIGR02270 family)